MIFTKAANYTKRKCQQVASLMVKALCVAPTSTKQKVEKAIRHPDMCIDRLIHAMKQLHFSLILLQNFKRTIQQTKVPIAKSCDHLIDQWHCCDYWYVVSLARFNINDSRVLQVPSCPQDGGLVQGWESVCSIGFQDIIIIIIIDFPKIIVQGITDSRKCFWEMRDICAVIVEDFENAKTFFETH
jgi:hypothetical protein